MLEDTDDSDSENGLTAKDIQVFTEEPQTPAATGNQTPNLNNHSSPYPYFSFTPSAVPFGASFSTPFSTPINSFQ